MEVQRGLYQTGMSPIKYTGVPAHAYAITTGDAPRTMLFTCHVVSAIAITIYDKTKKIGALLHVDYDECNTIENVFSRFKALGSQLNQLEVHIIGGCAAGSFGIIARDNYKNLRRQILQTTTKVVDLVPYMINHHFWHLIETKRIDEYNEKLKSYQYTQICLDVSTGQVFTSFDPQLAIEREDRVYSKKARIFAEKALNARQKPNTLLEILKSPLEEVYDGTNA